MNSLTRLPQPVEGKRRRTNGVMLRNGRYQAVAVPPDLDSSFVADPIAKDYFTAMKELFELRLTQSAMHRFHWITQMLFFFGFVVFCLFYFLVYPNLHIVSIDPACDKTQAEWFADIV